jgi:hypothetical protein
LFGDNLKRHFAAELAVFGDVGFADRVRAERIEDPVM